MTKADYMNPNEVAKMLGVTSETLLAWSGKGQFPAPIELGPRCRRWKRTDLETFLNEKRIQAKRSSKGVCCEK